MLVLAWRYCKLCKNEYSLLKMINIVINHSLPDDNVTCKKRDYLWFKKYISNSTILLETYEIYNGIFTHSIRKNGFLDDKISMVALAKRTQNDSRDGLDEAGEQASHVFIRITQRAQKFFIFTKIDGITQIPF